MKKYGRLAERPKKRGRNNEVAVRRGSTVIFSRYCISFLYTTITLKIY